MRAPLSVSLVLYMTAALGASVAAQDGEVVTTASGLQYEVLVPGGDGPAPRLGDTVRVHYTGTLTDGTTFDSSRTHGTPAEFRLGEVIQGWNEGLQLMTPGARYRFTIPAELGYGERGSPPVIPANATLVFDVELLDVIPAPEPPEFVAPNAEEQVELESGLKYEVVEPGEGANATDDDVIELRYSIWTKSGQLLESSKIHGQSIKAPMSAMTLPLLQEAPKHMNAGCTLRLEVPAELGFGDQRGPGGLPPGSDTVWELELVDVLEPLPVPEFHLPAADALATTGSGLQYEVVKLGKGGVASPQMGETVTVHYAGWLTDGTPFDSSYSRGEPMSFQLGRVIQGWNEGLQLMTPGAVFVFVIPPELAYGERGAPPVIGPNETLVFHVELIE